MRLDEAIVEFDHAVRSVFAPAKSMRSTPGDAFSPADLSDEDRKHVAGLMRVNHCGEICAQALYQGQALTSREPATREELRRAAAEETEHLAWTEQRLSELGSHKSVLNPLFYVGALSLGVLAGKLGDKWNLGFLAETERQVEAHLDGHLDRLPPHDQRSRAIVTQMRDDEIQHAEMAVRFGAAELPAPIKGLMRQAAKVMTGLAYRI